MKKGNKCEAPWACTRLTSETAGDGGRHIGGLSLCRGCYQYVWEQAKERQLSSEDFAELMYELPGPMARPSDEQMRCGGPGCGDILPKGSQAAVRRFVGRTSTDPGIPACRPCYQRAYELAKESGGESTLEEAFKSMPPRKRRSEK